MGALVLTCGKAGSGWDADAPRQPGVGLAAVPAVPGRDDLDPVLADLAGRRLVVHGTDADLAAVVLRLLRTDRLGTVAVGFVPADPDSAVAELWRLPRDPLGFALRAEVRPIPLIRDDNGGVLVGSGSTGRVTGEAYCDDQLALRGTVDTVEVTPDPAGGAGLIATVVRRRLLRSRAQTFRGRAFQLGCHGVVPVRDGVAHPRRLPRWTWYRHTEELLAIRGLG